MPRRPRPPGSGRRLLTLGEAEGRLAEALMRGWELSLYSELK